MATLLQRLRTGRSAERSSLPDISLSEWMQMFKFDGLNYNVATTGTLGGKERDISPDYQGYVNAAYRSNGIVFACMVNRMMLFSQGRFQYQRLRNGRPGDYFGTQGLAILEKPFGPSSTTGDLLARAIQDADLAGNHYATVDQGVIRRLPPHYVTIILGSQREAGDPSLAWDAEPIGYVYDARNGSDPEVFYPEQIAHFAPIPDPLARYRGMSWMTPVLRQVTADNAMSAHQLKYFEQGATPNTVVTIGADLSPTAFKRWQELFASQNEGIRNAYKTMILTAGATPHVVGSRLEDFKTVKGHGETVIAAASGIHPVIIGLSEGLQGSSLNAGNFASARRLTADRTLHSLWQNIASSYAPLVAHQNGAELAIDTRDIPFLREDAKDAAEIQSTHAQTIHTLISAGYKPDSVVAAVVSGDMTLLTHTGMYSVQLQPAGSITEGKGSVVQGLPVAKGQSQPAASPAAKQASKDPYDVLRGVLAPFTGGREQ